MPGGSLAAQPEHETISVNRMLDHLLSKLVSTPFINMDGHVYQFLIAPEIDVDVLQSDRSNPSELTQRLQTLPQVCSRKVIAFLKQHAPSQQLISRMFVSGELHSANLVL